LRLGIRTGGIERFALQADYHYYSTISYRATLFILSHVGLGPDDVFVDIGCGKGRVLCSASRLGIREAIGIEVDPHLSQIASANARRVRGRTCPVTVLNLRAEDWDYSKGSVFYLFNPFGAQTMDVVLKRVKKSWDARPRRLTFIYVNPVHESVVADCSWLSLANRWHAEEKPFLSHTVSVWQSPS